MKTFLKAGLYLLLMAAIAYGAYYGYRLAKEKSQPPSEKKDREALPVRVMPVQTGCVTNAIKLTGSLEAIRTVDVMPKISGRLEPWPLTTARRSGKDSTSPIAK
jgi:multidrug efflux pump subunit AcrA (membrane-fusion protein)